MTQEKISATNAGRAERASTTSFRDQYLELLRAVLGAFQVNGLRATIAEPALSEDTCLARRRSYFGLAEIEIARGGDAARLIYRFPFPTTRGTLLIDGREMSPTLRAVPRPGARPFTDVGADLEMMFVVPAEIRRLQRLLRRFIHTLERTPKLDDAAIEIEGLVNLRYFPHLIALDQTNLLSEVAETRKIYLPRGANAPMYHRFIHDSHIGRVCPFETPESAAIGLEVFLASEAELLVTPDGFVIEPAAEDSAAGFLGLSLRTVPFLHHSDGARGMMGGKNFKQALPLVQGEAPLITTGDEQLIVDRSGRLIRASASGTLQVVERDGRRSLGIIDERGEVAETHELLGRFISNSDTPLGHNLVARDGDDVAPGDLLAEWPGTTAGEFALGRNALVAYIPFFGYNIDDAVVVSRSFSEKLTTAHLYEYILELTQGEELTTEARGNEHHRLAAPGVIGEGETVLCGALLARKRDAAGTLIDLRFSEYATGTVERVETSETEARVWVSGIRPLQVGDKVTGRHGNKGVVSLILEDADMPFFRVGEQTHHTEVLLNPNGIVSRMNLGQLLETHYGWLAKFTPSMGRRVGMAFRPIAVDQLRTQLTEAGLTDGKAKLHLVRDGNKRDLGHAVVGYQYILRLNHLAADKLHIRSTGPYSAVTGQPLRGRERNGGQRLGEMEVWCLLAHGAYRNLEELLGAKSDDAAARDALRRAMRTPSERCASIPCNCYSLFCSEAGAPLVTGISQTFLVLQEYLRALGIDLTLHRRDGRKARTSQDITELRMRPASEKTIRAWTKGVTIDDVEALDNSENFGVGEGDPTSLEHMAQVRLEVGLPHPLLDLAEPTTLVPVLPPRSRPPTLEGSPAELTRLYQRLVVANRALLFERPALESIRKQRRTLKRLLDVNNWPLLRRALISYSAVARQIASPSSSVEWKLAILNELLMDGERLTERVTRLPEFFRAALASAELRSTLHDARLKGSDSLLRRALRARLGDADFARRFNGASVLRRLAVLRSDSDAALAEALNEIPVVRSLLERQGELLRELTSDPVIRRYIDVEKYDDPFTLMAMVQERLSNHHTLKQALASEPDILDVDESEIVGGALSLHSLHRKIRFLERAFRHLIVGGQQMPRARSISEHIEGKYGLLRHDLLGKRVDYSGRAVIVPDPALRIDEAGIPMAIAAELFAPELERRLGLRGVSVAALDSHIVRRDGDPCVPPSTIERNHVREIVNEIIREYDPLVLLNRAPSLHKYNVLAFRPVMRDDHVIALPPLIASAFNADFDGDTMAIHLPIGKASQIEARRLLPSNNLFKLANGDLLLSLGQDFALGAHLVKDRDSYRGLFVKDVPKSKAELGRTLKQLASEKDSFVERMLRIQEVLLDGSVDGSASFSFFDALDLSRRVEIPIERDVRTLNGLAADAVEHAHYDQNPLSLYRRAGARGDKNQFRQIVGAVGVIERGSRVGSVVVPPIILHSFVTGLATSEYRRLAHTTRRTMLDKKLSVAPAGALTRDLIEGAYEITIGAMDCGSGDDGLGCQFDADTFTADAFQGRVLAGSGTEVQVIRSGRAECTQSGTSEKLGDKVRIRSPLTCALAPRICQRCYGVSLETGYWVPLGTLVGIHAAQSVGERGTQLSMQTFHTGGYAPDVRSVRAILCDGSLSSESVFDQLVALHSIYRGERVASIHFEVLLKAMQLAPPGTSGLVSVGSDAQRRGVLAAASYRGTRAHFLDMGAGTHVDTLTSPKIGVLLGRFR